MKTGADWAVDFEKRSKHFAKRYRVAYTKSKRELFALFEIGCFQILVDEISKTGLQIVAKNLTKNGEFRYLTSPSGNPDKFSYVQVSKDGAAKFDLRQQVRIRSHLHADITFTPDIVLLKADAKIARTTDPTYANGKRGLFAAASADVASVYECKSLNGFPELYVSFVGMVNCSRPTNRARRRAGGVLSSSLFVGGESSGFHVRMLLALEDAVKVNILTGVHKGGWVLNRKVRHLFRLK